MQPNICSSFYVFSPPQQIFSEVDSDGNGVVDFDEFIIMLSKKKQDEEILKETFASFDIDGDGYITRQELVTFMEKTGEELTSDQIQQMMGEQDEDGDGRISYQGNGATKLALFYLVLSVLHVVI